jgi:hypothetical protein
MVTFLGVCRFRRLQFTEEGPFFQAFHDFKKGVCPLTTALATPTPLSYNQRLDNPKKKI